MTSLDRIRNFVIIAHIDHGKSTLADRIIEYCGGIIGEREKTDRILDSMDLEKEKGITIKAQTVRLDYKSDDRADYVLNLMDTPGHVDFTYEVNRCLAACEGSLLLVDATQGVEAQTLANTYHALENNHKIIPVLNKIDLPSADVEKTKNQVEEIIGIDAGDAILISAKTGEGVKSLLEAVVHDLPAPRGDVKMPLRSMLIDSWYDSYLGVVVLIRVIDGALRRGDRIKMLATNGLYQVETLGFFTPKRVGVETIAAGEIGFFTGQIKQVADCRIGDTIVLAGDNETKPLAGFKANLPVVFCSLYPTDSGDYDLFKESLARLHLNDASFVFEPETSSALGFGFRCGFLGLLHLEIVEERLEREFDLDLIITAPSVVYRVYTGNMPKNLVASKVGDYLEVHNSADLPEPQYLKKICEPWVKATLMVPEEYLGNILRLCADRRGIQSSLTFVGERAMLIYELPLNEIIYDFYDKLKSYSSGYASLDWEILDYREGDLTKLSILVNGEPVDALSFIVHRSRAESRGRALCEKLKNLIPRQMFKIAIQAGMNGRIIARETINAYMKDVLAKCYGGDVTRKRKLLEKQKKGKKRMKVIGNVEIPQSAFLAALRLDD
ncbi:MAG: translation elongation factor 4 [Rickettsiales bacterium]|jgi:GTP-binding protein LepA|nr:translation elongation factor 4 [Rickettsiales bacterium]